MAETSTLDLEVERCGDGYRVRWKNTETWYSARTFYDAFEQARKHRPSKK